MSRSASLLFFAALASAQAAPRITPDVIYGDDNRADLYQVDPSWHRFADSTVALFRADRVRSDGSGYSQLATVPIGQRMNLCTDEPFYEQGAGAFCSGSLVGPDLVLTAGHCITSAGDCRGTKIVFGFAVRQQGQLPTSVPTSEVYQCSSIVSRALDEVTMNDYAVVRLDRPVVGHAPLEISRGPALTAGAGLVMIGHPSGLPVKIAGGASVRDASNPYYYVANTDSYGGNSGSPVFNATTGLIEGVLVRGETDYVDDPRGCTASYRCTDTGCRGEDVTKVSVAAAFIPPLSGGVPGVPNDPWTQPSNPGFGGGGGWWQPIWPGNASR